MQMPRGPIRCNKLVYQIDDKKIDDKGFESKVKVLAKGNKFRCFKEHCRNQIKHTS